MIPEAGLLNKSSCLTPALVVAELITVVDIILVTLCCAACLIKLAFKAGLLNKRLTLSSSFDKTSQNMSMFEKIHKCQLYDFRHTLLCYSSRKVVLDTFT
jgi:hypothetical protein